MNITLSADKKIVDKARKYAEKHRTSLNSLVRDYLENISGEKYNASNSKEFAGLAFKKAGRSPEGFHFDREEAHRR